jgi:hypothetical protein
MKGGMHGMKQNSESTFTHEHYIALIKSIVGSCTRFFGYLRRPRIVECQNDEGAAMIIRRTGRNRYTIFCDYDQFVDNFGELDFEGQEAYCALLISHEMRHYYQMRQLESRWVRESEETLRAWQENDDCPKIPSEDFSVLDFYMQPMEIDAELFAYLFVAYNLGIRVSLDFIDEGYIHELKKYCIEYLGEADDEVFSNEW